MKTIFFGLFTILLLAGVPVSAQTNQTIQELVTAAGKGDAEAQLNLGLHYYSGTGVTKDDVESVKWIRKAAEQNLDMAQALLGVHTEMESVWRRIRLRR